jgi:tryptophan-rich sensory protein
MSTIVRFALSVTVPLAVGVLSGLATARGVQDWYPTLVKPSFNPPSWVFGPVWTVLYIMMGLAAFLVWQKGLATDFVRTALALFILQLVLNGIWSILFFGLRAPGWAFVEIVVLWVAIFLTLIYFWRVTAPAGILLAPYLAWVSFATVLNGSIWFLNR